MSYNADLVYVDTESTGAFLLNRKTGKTIEKLKGVEFIRESSYAEINQFEKKSISTLVNRNDRSEIISFSHKSFAILDACFSKDKLLVAYSGNPLEAISLKTHETLWSIKVLGHILKTAYSEALNKFVGIRWEYEKGSNKFLCHINAETGLVDKEIDLGAPSEIEFLKKGSMLITSDGVLYSTIDGEILKKFENWWT